MYVKLLMLREFFIELSCVVVCKCVFLDIYHLRALKFLLESGVDVNMQDDFSSVHRMARQKRYDANAGIHTGVHCNMHM